MNRRDRRAARKELTKLQQANRLPDKLTLVPAEEYADAPIEPKPIHAWRSRRYLVQLYVEKSLIYHDLHRLSISRVALNKDLRRVDGLTWDELQAIKREVGFGDWFAVEVYPRDRDIINHANMRHLWMLPMPLAIGWINP